MVNSRGANYTCDEDRHLCNVFISISQDPNMAANQRRDHFWSCIKTNYNSSKPSTVMQDRNQRSLQSRIQTIHQAVSKLNECIQQIECRSQNGVSEPDVLNRAKQLLQQDAKFRSGFKFDHVWTVMKDVARVSPKKQRRVDHCSSLQGDTVPEALIAPPPESSSFALNVSDENVSGGSSSKRKRDEDVSAIIKAMKEGNQKIRDLLMSREEKMQRIIDQKRKQIELQKRKIELVQWKEENKILMINLDTISDSPRREFFRKEQEMYMQKRRNIYAEKRENNGNQE